MVRTKFQKAIGKVKDKTSIGLAKVGSNPSLADLEIAIVKATRHDDHPPDERHIREILALTAYSPASVRATVASIAKRLNKTKNWTVALKTLVLVQRLLAEGDRAFHDEVFFATRRGTRLLNLADFRDSARASTHDYSSFVRTFALYLDDALEYRMMARHRKREASREKRAAASRMVARMQRLQQVLERFLACHPTGAAESNGIVRVALYPVVKESFRVYYDLNETIGVLIDGFEEMDVTDCFKVYDMLSRSTQQFDELGKFYVWAKDRGIARSLEYPDVERIGNEKLIRMVDCIRERSECATEAESRGGEMNVVKALPAREQDRVEKQLEALVEPKIETNEEV